jgi:hypothetical protein
MTATRKLGRPPGRKDNPFRTPMPFKRSEVSRAIRGVINQGLEIERVEVNPRTGLITITPRPSVAAGEKVA